MHSVNSSKRRLGRSEFRLTPINLGLKINQVPKKILRFSWVDLVLVIKSLKQSSFSGEIFQVKPIYYDILNAFLVNAGVSLLLL
jgi:hypothetical protein